AVVIIIRLYNTAAKKMAKIMSVNALLEGNLNSSAACGILSKPTNAHGAIATIDIITASAVLSVGNNGFTLESPDPGCTPTMKARPITLRIMTTKKINCILPYKPVTLILKSQKITYNTVAILI